MKIYDGSELLMDVSIDGDSCTVKRYRDHIKVGRLRDKQGVEEFLGRRCIPAGRENIDALLSGEYGIKSYDVFDICRVTQGRQPVDNVWVSFDDEGLKDQPALDGVGRREKVWEDGICIKKDTVLGESLMEGSACRIAKAFGIDTVMYDFEGSTGSRCTSYLSDGCCSVSLQDILPYDVVGSHGLSRDVVIGLVSMHTGIQECDLCAWFDRICVFDYIIANKGRSYANVDLIMDAEGKYTFAPVHGYGQAFFNCMDSISLKQVNALSSRYKSGLFSRKPVKNFSSLKNAQAVAEEMYETMRGSYKSIRHIDGVLKAHARIAEQRLERLLSLRS